MATVPSDRKPKRRPIVTSDTSRSLVEIVSSPDAEKAAPIGVFSIDGVTYSMPGAIPASFTLQVLDHTRKEGEIAATAWMLEEVLGTEAYDVLKACPWLTSDQLQAIMDRVSEHVMGQVEVTGK